MPQTDSSMTQSYNGGLMITSEVVIDIVKRDIKVSGLEEAIRNFKPMRGYFATVMGWAETVKQVDDLFSEARTSQEKEKARLLSINQNLNLTMKGDNLSYTEIQ